MVVLQQIRVGFSEQVRACSMARWTASASWPSTFGITCQPKPSKRLTMSSPNQPRTGPSMEMPLSSYRQISLPSPQVPASEHAS